MNVTVISTSRSTFTSYKFDSTIEGLQKGGWEFSPEEITELYDGKTVVLFSDNRKISVTESK